MLSPGIDGSSMRIQDAARSLFSDAMLRRISKPAVAGPSLDWIQEKSVDATWSLASHHLSLLSQEGFPAYFRFNMAKELRSARARQTGLYILAAAVLAYSVALVYVLKEAV